jgi:DNA replication protein DnaC
MSDINTVIKDSLKQLRLPAIREYFEEYADVARSETISYEQYLFELVQQEQQERRDNRIKRYLSQSHLPPDKTIESFELDRLPVGMVHHVNTLLEGSFIDRRENILTFGQPGTGKTHLVCAIGRELINQGYRVYFSSTSLLVQDMLLAKRELNLKRLLNKYSRFDAMILDDLGYVQQSREEMEVLFTLLAERYERGSTIITSNLPFSQWEKIFKDPMTTAAAIDRLVHHSVILELNIPSYRMEAAEKKQKEKSNE